MNYKMLLPTYRERFLGLIDALSALKNDRQIDGNGMFLNLGCGEGDLDDQILEFFRSGNGCDVNFGDIAHCLRTRTDGRIQYVVTDAHHLPYVTGRFDCVVCIDVIEHTEDPQRVIQEAARVLRPRGVAVFSFPRRRFPLSYDPINAALRSLGRKLAIGAYAYGHEKLIDDEEFVSWTSDAGLRLVYSRLLSRGLIGLLECYWAGFAQSLLKANAGNQPCDLGKTRALRPSREVPSLVSVTDGIIALDRKLFSWSPASVGRICILQK